MRVSRDQAKANRERILDVAATLFRQKGFDGIGVADLMKSAGLTHGGFYGHFTSKDDLAAQACARALARSAERWKQLAEERPADGLAALTTYYLSEAHRDNPGRGCPMAALGAEVARQEGPVRRAFTEGIRPLIDALARLIPGRSKAARREKALATMAGLIGATILARAVDDQALSEEILAASAATFGANR